MLTLCNLGEETYVLNVGCGSGSTNLYLAETYGCRSVGVDIKEDMVAAAREWAKRYEITDLVEYHQAPAAEMPFADDTFDLVISESVNVFVPDRPKAMAEYLRVVKPGGRVGLNEPILLKPPSPEIEKMLQEVVGHELYFADYWLNLFEEAGLDEIQSQTGAVKMMEESRNQTAFFKKRDFIFIIGRMIKELLSSRYTRSLVKEIGGSNPKEYFDYMGYGVFVGKKRTDN